jgi:hypothetical protein
MNIRGSVAAIVAALALAGLALTGWVPGLTPGLICVAAFRALALIGLNLIFGVVGISWRLVPIWPVFSSIRSCRSCRR